MKVNPRTTHDELIAMMRGFARSPAELQHCHVRSRGDRPVDFASMRHPRNHRGELTMTLDINARYIPKSGHERTRRWTVLLTFHRGRCIRESGAHPQRAPSAAEARAPV